MSITSRAFLGALFLYCSSKELPLRKPLSHLPALES